MMLAKAAMNHNHIRVDMGRASRACTCCATRVDVKAKRAQRRRTKQVARSGRYEF